MLADVTSSLACPVCSAPLSLDVRTLRCANRHAYDVAREGYVSLLAGPAAVSTADTVQMVRARREFLSTEHFRPLATAVVTAAGAVDEGVAGVFLDAGGGTGEYLIALLDSCPSRHGITLDGSKHAAKAAAREHPRMVAIVADVWKTLPLRDESCAVITSIFAPRNAEEFARVLAPGGALVVAVPGTLHLHEIGPALGLLTVDPEKRQRLKAKLDPFFRLEAEQHVHYGTQMARAEAALAACMGPAASHASTEEIESRAKALSDTVATTVSVDVLTYRRAPAM